MTLSTQCYVKSTLYKKFDPSSNIGWHDPSNVNYNPTFVWLAGRALLVGEAYYVRRPSGEWAISKKSSAAIGDTLNLWSGIHSVTGGPITVAIDQIKNYWRQPLHVDGEMMLPFGPLYFEYGSKLYLNSWQDVRMPYSKLDLPWAEPALSLIYKSLLGRDENASLTTMMEALDATNDPEYAWVMQWLANMYQCPGRKPQTSLWLCGEYGSGKGTLAEMMGRLIGQRYRTGLKEGEIERGWTTNLANMLYVVAEEFDGESKVKQYRFIKEHSSDSEIELVTRGVGQTKLLNLAQWAFHTNNRDNAVIVKPNDRRHTFINGREFTSVAAAAYFQERVRVWAVSLSDPNDPTFDERYLAGFAAVLGELPIDFGFINRPLTTPLKAKFVRAGTSPLERLVEDFDSFGGSAGENVRAWWEVTCGPPRAPDETLYPAEFFEYLKKHTGFHSRKTISDYLADHGYDYKLCFPKKRPSSTAGATRHTRFNI